MLGPATAARDQIATLVTQMEQQVDVEHNNQDAMEIEAATTVASAGWRTRQPPRSVRPRRAFQRMMAVRAIWKKPVKLLPNCTDAPWLPPAWPTHAHRHRDEQPVFDRLDQPAARRLFTDGRRQGCDGGTAVSAPVFDHGAARCFRQQLCLDRQRLQRWFNPANWSPAGVPGAQDAATINSGSPTLTANVNIASLFLNGGNLSGSSSLFVGNTLDWASGSIFCPVTVLTNAAMNWISSGTFYLYYSAITNAGTINWYRGGSINIYNNNSPGSYTGGINNLAGGAFNVQCDADMNRPTVMVMNTSTMPELLRNSRAPTRQPSRGIHQQRERGCSKWDDLFCGRRQPGREFPGFKQCQH